MASRVFLLLLICLLPILIFSQTGNVGIGTTTPTGPLSFSSNIGNKIVLWGDGNTSHYGLGIQGGLLQVYANQITDNIVFGTGRSSVFTERMRIINSGGDGLLLNGRILLRNGTNPLDINYGSGVWMYKADNSALLGFMGAQNNQNLGFYGGPAGWGFTYDAINSRVGIGNNNPNAPLAFPPSLGKKITLYPGNTGDVGFGVAGNRLQIYSDNPNADVAIGYDAAGVFNERFAVKPNGALAIVGNLGQAGQVITSNGNAASSWQSPTNFIFQHSAKKESQSSIQVLTNAREDVPDLNFSFTLSSNGIVLVNYNYFAIALPCTFCGRSGTATEIYLDGNLQSTFVKDIENGALENIAGSSLVIVGPGNHNIKIMCKNSGPTIRVGKQFSDVNSEASIIVIPQ